MNDCGINVLTHKAHLRYHIHDEHIFPDSTLKWSQSVRQLFWQGRQGHVSHWKAMKTSQIREIAWNTLHCQTSVSRKDVVGLETI